MTENELIQEMAKAICKSRGITDVDDCEKCWRCDNIDSCCLYQEIANGLYNKGYRKFERGEWIRQTKELGVIKPEAICSNCGRSAVYQIIDDRWAWENYCPHCGADMRGEGK